MAKTRCIILTNGDAARIQEYLSLDMNKKHAQKNGSMISRSVQFPDGFSVRLTCCGVPSGVSYAEAILCDPNGEEVISSGPQNKILGYWLLPFDGREYALSVSAKAASVQPEDVSRPEQADRTAEADALCMMAITEERGCASLQDEV